LRKLEFGPAWHGSVFVSYFQSRMRKLHAAIVAVVFVANVEDEAARKIIS
jgi:hypothetical protein